MLTRRGKSRSATPLRALVHQVTVVIKAKNGLGKKKKTKEMGRAPKDETLWDADGEG